MQKDKRKFHQICEDFLDRSMELYDVPGLVIGVRWGDGHKTGPGDALTFTGARGYKNYMTKDPLQADHIFHCGSVSKLFTSMGIMKLVEEGKLDLQERLVDLLPYLSIADRRCENIRLHHMLTHTSGMGDVEDYHWDEPRIDEQALKDYALSEEVRETPMLWAPGEGGFRYSNMAYELLGLIIAERSGKSYEDFMMEHFLKPAGMKNSTFLTFERTGGSLAPEVIDRTNMAMPHVKAADRSIVLEPHYPYNRQHGPSSTLTSDVYDLMKWANFNIKKRAVDPALYEEIWHQHATVPNNGEGMGLGWFMRQQEGYEFLGHEGTDDGFRASFWFCRQLDLAIIVLSNMTKAPVKKLNKGLCEALIRS
ncbi:MAG: serine hydrolase domain-containing protein [Bacillota bacterium]|nr:serine hydrolase domain-containing protein [Bacillota bacterium]